MKLTDIPVPTGAASVAAAQVLAEHSSPALVNHCHRSYLLAAALGVTEGVTVDDELLYVAAMMHDLGLEPAFDNVALPFEDAGAHLVSVFAAGAGWSLLRRRRAADIVIAHMRHQVDPGVEPEGYLLEAATSVDISGRDPHRWPAPLLAQVYACHPRLDLAAQFTARFQDQARRKPDSAAAAAVGSGIADRIRANRVGETGEARDVGGVGVAAGGVVGGGVESCG